MSTFLFCLKEASGSVHYCIRSGVWHTGGQGINTYAVGERLTFAEVGGVWFVIFMYFDPQLPLSCVPDSLLLSPWRCAEAPGTWGGVRVHPAQCLRAVHSHHPLGGARRQSEHQLCQDGVLGDSHIPHEAFLWRESPQVKCRPGGCVPSHDTLVFSPPEGACIPTMRGVGNQDRVNTPFFFF